MRIIKFFFTFLAIIVIGGLVGLVIARKVLINTAISQIKESVKVIKSQQVLQQNASKCLAKGVDPHLDEIIVTLQLRFTSDTNYVVEAVCSGFTSDPILIKENKLPTLVKKLPGNSGILWGDELSGVSITALGTDASVFVQDSQVFSNSSSLDELETALGPATTCGGYGFSCCQSETQKGVGDQLVGSLDCAQTCYSTCQARPVVLSFNTRPYFNAQTRELRVKPGQQVSFSYTASGSFSTDPSSNLDQEGWRFVLFNLLESIFSDQQDTQAMDSVEVEIEFGDGKSSLFSDVQGTIDHVYSCTKPSCTYLARVKVVNQNDAGSVDTPISRIKVIVSR